MLTRSTCPLTAAALALAVPGAALAAPAPQVEPEILVTNLPGLPTSEVPGFPGVEFTFEDDAGLLEVKGSPSGHWIAGAEIPDPSSPGDNFDVLLVDGTVVLVDGQVAPWDPAGNVVRDIDATSYDVNNNGDFAFSARLDTGSVRQQVVRSVGGQFSVAAEPGSDVPSIPGARFGTLQSNVVLLGDGSTGFKADNLQGVPAAQRVAVFLDGELLLHSGVTVPPGQAGGRSKTFQNVFFSLRFWATEDGEHWGGTRKPQRRRRFGRRPSVRRRCRTPRGGGRSDRRELTRAIRVHR